MKKIKVKDGMSQNDIVLAHLKANKKQGITPMEGFSMYGITRLSGRVFELRQSGIDIVSTQETSYVPGTKRAKNYARYTLAS